MSSAGKKNIAHKGSGHGAAAPGAISLMPGAPPVPTPFVYTCRTANVCEERRRYTVGGDGILLDGDAMDMDPPANKPSQGTGGDVVTHAAMKIGVMASGSMCMTITGKMICATGDLVRMNVLSAQMKVAQVQVPLLEAADFEKARKGNLEAHKMNEKYFRAYHPERANQTKIGDPVDVGTGFVVDVSVDLQLPGPLPLVWERSYSSALAARSGALGRGGWLHAFEQWVEPRADGVRLFDEEGLAVDFPQSHSGGPSFHRGRQLELRSVGNVYEVRSIVANVTRTFSTREDGRIALSSLRDGWGNRIELFYAGSALVRVVDSAGRELRITNDDRGRVRRVEVWASDPAATRADEGPPQLRTWFEYGYHPEGELASHTNALGHTKSWAYDGLHRLTGLVGRNGTPFRFEYEGETGRCVRSRGEGGLHDVRLVFDGPKGETLVHGTARARRYQWVNGVVVRESTLDEGWAVEREYDADELLVSTKNAAGEAHAYERDERGNIVKLVDSAGNETTWELASDRPIRRLDPDGTEIVYAYDTHGTLVELTLPSGNPLRVERDGRGLVAALFDDNGLTVRYAYDSSGSIAAETNARGIVTRYRHDALGRPVERIDPLGNVTRVEYDLLGQVTALHRADGAVTRSTWDRVGNLASYTDGLGRTTAFEYSGTGRLAKLTQANGQVYRLLRDADERVVEVVNPRLERWSLEYDRVDRVTRETTYDGRSIHYRYDLAGRPTRVDYPEGEWREYAYDPLGNVVEDRGADLQITFARDALGRIEKATSTDVMGKVVVAIERDTLGRVLRETHNGRALAFEYDPSGARIARTLPDGQRTAYRYDEEGALTAIVHDGKELSFERNMSGREVRRAFGRWSLLQDPDPMGRIARVRLVVGEGADAPVTMDRRRVFDPADRLVQIDKADGSGAEAIYEYDVADRLLVATAPAGHEVFEYDPTGSVVLALEGLEARQRTWALGTGNRLVQANGSRFVDDDCGRRICRVESEDGDTRTTYGWDSKGQLREIVKPDGTRVRFVYDAFGRRVRKDVVQGGGELGSKVTVTSTEFLWDDDVICEERRTGKPARVHVHLPGTFTPVLQSEGDATYGVLTDHLGTPSELVDEAGRVRWRNEYALWGGGREDEDLASPFGHLGHYVDREVGLHYVRFRYFDPSTVRWLSPDPLGLQGGLNPFAFDGAPTLTVDPLGLMEPPWEPHSPTQDDIISKGLHFNTEDRKVELGVRQTGGEVTFAAVFSPKNRPPDTQIKLANQKLKTDYNWRWELLTNLNEGIKILRNTFKRPDMAKQMEAVRDALTKLIAKKDGHA